MKVINKTHYGMTVSLVDVFEGKHKDICVCHHDCQLFKPGKEDNCSIAEIAYQLSKMTGIVLVHSCEIYKK